MRRLALGILAVVLLAGPALAQLPVSKYVTLNAVSATTTGLVAHAG